MTLKASLDLLTKLGRLAEGATTPEMKEVIASIYDFVAVCLPNIEIEAYNNGHDDGMNAPVHREALEVAVNAALDERFNFGRPDSGMAGPHVWVRDLPSEVGEARRIIVSDPPAYCFHCGQVWLA